jgi:hypothetical protein
LWCKQIAIDIALAVTNSAPFRGISLLAPFPVILYIFSKSIARLICTSFAFTVFATSRATPVPFDCEFFYIFLDVLSNLTTGPICSSLAILTPIGTLAPPVS